MKEKISAAAKLLLPALRQYQHNDGSGLLAGYDLDTTQRIFAALTVSPAPSGEVEAVEVVARLLTWRGPKYQPVPHGGICARHYAEYPENHYPDGPWAEGEPLMTVAQHQRIVAAKDAEIARLYDDLNETELRALKFIHQCNAHVDLYRELRDERDELRAQLAEKDKRLRQEQAYVSELAEEHTQLEARLAQLAAQQAAVPVGRELLERIAGTGCDPDCCIAYERGQLRARLNTDRSAQGGE